MPKGIYTRNKTKKSIPAKASPKDKINMDLKSSRKDDLMDMRSELEAAITDLEVSTRAHEMRGGGDPLLVPVIEADHERAHAWLTYKLDSLFRELA